jgi:hypothetical protein
MPEHLNLNTHWFYTVWPFIGVGGAIVMIAVLLWTDAFRANLAVARWRDLVWLAWLAVPLYLLHQFEEYSLQTVGLDYSIQDMIAQKLGYPEYPDCPIPLAFYPIVNIALMWFGSPLAAHLSRRNVLLGLSFWGLIFANGIVHTLGGIMEGAYNTGLWTAVFLFIPLSLWVIYATAIRGPYSGKVVGVSFACGAVTHAALFGGYGMYKVGMIGNTGLLVYACVIGFMPLILAAIACWFFKPELLRPVLTPTTHSVA